MFSPFGRAIWVHHHATFHKCVFFFFLPGENALFSGKLGPLMFRFRFICFAGCTEFLGESERESVMVQELSSCSGCKHCPFYITCMPPCPSQVSCFWCPYDLQFSGSGWHFCITDATVAWKFTAREGFGATQINHGSAVNALQGCSKSQGLELLYLIDARVYTC